MNPELQQVRLGGEAGQGVILAGVMLAEVAAFDNKEVGQSARYGAAVRGGEATADVVIADKPIDFPHVEAPDYLVVFSQQTYDKYAPMQAPGTLIIYDPFFVEAKPLPDVRQVGIAATDAAIKKFGKSTGANVISLAALISLTGVVTSESLLAYIGSNPDKRFSMKNLESVAIGENLAAKIKNEADK